MSTTKIVYSSDFDDDEWRDVNFSEEKLAAARTSNTKQPTAEELIKAAEKYGPDGILDSAILLPQFKYKKVADALKKMRTR